MIVIVHFLLAGFMCNNKDIPIYLMPFHYANIHTYMFNALMKNQFDFWDESDCGVGAACDPLDFMNIEFSVWENIFYASL